VPAFAAVDLGATSGRVVRVTIDPDAGRFDLDTVHRFTTPTSSTAGGITWDLPAILAQLRRGLASAAHIGPLASIGVDSWAVDYVLYDADGNTLGPVHAYRSPRTAGVMEQVTAHLGRERIYASTGIQFLPFNTLYQLVAAQSTPDYQAARRLLMIPDAVNHHLCGSVTNDVTNASTTQLLHATARRWDTELAEALDLRTDVLPELHEPGTLLGVVSGIDPALDGTPVIAVASHDTASAVVGTPLDAHRPAAYVSCGTWALVGCERSAPVLTSQALAANVTNELGVDGTVRLLKNVTGLWLLEECRRTWTAQGLTTTAAELVADAIDVPRGAVVDPDDPRFAKPGELPDSLIAACRESGQSPPATPAAVTRVILDSLAEAWARTVTVIEQVAGFRAEVVHLVGGGAAVGLLRRLGADACGRPILAGPVEATVAGNAIVQAVAAGVLPDIASGRALAAAATDVLTVAPGP
jgi:rhamnulokinase